MAVQAAQTFDWWLDVDNEGYREYHIVQLVRTSTPLRYSGSWSGDGPLSILSASGIPAVGSALSMGNDANSWMLCKPDRTVRIHDKKQGEPVTVYSVESVYSNRPLDRCMSSDREDPLDEPQRVRGNSMRYTIEAAKDRNGDPIMSSSHEMYRGPQVEFDGGRDQVVIEQNVADLELGLCTSLRNSVNDDTLWGLAARRIKLSDFSWEEKWYNQCIYYYTRIFTFDIRNNPEDLFDRTLLDEGTKVLNGRWDSDTGYWTDLAIPGYGGSPNPDPDNPQHFTRYKDRLGENTRVILDGKGRPANAITTLGTGTSFGTGTDSTDAAGQHLIEYYPEADLTQLNIPTSLDFGTAAS